MNALGTEYFTKLDQAGQIPTTTDGNLFNALQLLPRDHPARPYVEAAAKSNSSIGLRLQALEEFGRKAFPEDEGKPVQRTGLRPGTMVADVAGGDDNPAGRYTGTVDPTLLTRENWAYFQNHNLGAKSGEIFTGPYRIGDPNKGPDHLYAAGDLTTAQEEPRIPGNRSLAFWG